MSAILILCLCCSVSSSVAAGGWFTGSIPGTGPHYIKIVEGEKLKKAVGDLSEELKGINTLAAATENDSDDGDSQATLDLVNFMNDMDKTKCETFLSTWDKSQELSVDPTLFYAEVSNVFTLSGTIPKEDHLYKYIGATETEARYLKEGCIRATTPE